ncbi:hypothetical protein [Pelagicoccus mobilis]|uniref:Porin n=1 Tax=Pelagicoccus mobilis TaxID=415221 RepID=A0A934RQF0_9BACT|nr:hypothetical protein [Pelagicoccus mobilis]MBK1875620.1 hypothetical protein [Pelagicoccus mobilis]
MTELRQHPLAFLLSALALIGSALETNAQSLSTGGFVSVGYLESSHYNYLADSEKGTLDFVEIGLNASWTPANRTTINGQAFLFELGPYGNYTPLVDYLFVDYAKSKELGFRAGRIKRELGLYTHIQDIDIARTSILLPHGMYDPRYRDFSASVDGASMYGSFNLPGDQRITYNLYGGFAQADPEGGLAGFSLTAISRTTIDNRIKTLEADGTYGAQFWYNPNIEGLRVGYGLSRYFGIDISTQGKFPDALPDPLLAGKELINLGQDLTYEIDQLSIEYFLGNWNFTAEYQWSHVGPTIDRIIGGVFFPDTTPPTEFEVWYANASRRFGKLEFGLTYTSSPFSKNDTNVGNATYQKDTQLSVRYDVNDHWTLKAEVHSIEGTKRLFNQHGQNPVLDQDDWTLWAAKSTFTF